MTTKKIHHDARAVAVRVERAFAKLNEMEVPAVFCRSDFKCCQSCGTAEVPDNHNYAFYHNQDLETLEETGIMHIAFGVAYDPKDPDADNDAECKAWGWVIVYALLDEGLVVDWHGDINKRIKVRMEGNDD